MKNRKVMWIAALCLLALFAQTTFASRQLSLTYDEPIYTAIGYADWTTGDVRWHGVIGHPPLVNLLTVWPLLLDPARPDPRQTPSWGSDDALGFSRAMMAQLGPLERVALVTRLPVMGLALLLGAFVYRWAQQAWGGRAGLLALGLFVFDPHIVAHAQLNTTDVGLAAFGFMGCYALARYLRRPTWMTYAGTGLGLGAALASKASGPFWLAAAGLVAILFWLTADRTRSSLWTWLFRLIGLAGIALLVLWAAYLFELRPLDAGELPIPAASHWEGLPYIRSYMASGQRAFLAGQLVASGHWAYFPLALLVKTPLPTLVGLSLAIGWSFRRGVGPRWSAIPLTVVPAAYLVVAMLMALNIGHRHMVPLLPFACVFISQLAGKRGPSLGSGHRWRRAALGLLAIWYVVGTLRISPHYLAYFNELAGGPDNGYCYLADSSVDWGQGLMALKSYLAERGIKQMRLAAFSSLDPARYGLRFEPLPPTVGAPITLPAPFNPQPGVYVISAVPLQGVWLLDPDTYDWFRHREPLARVGHALFVYDVPPADPAPGWVAQCAAPVPSLDADQVAEGFGRSDLRLAVFDCEQSWLYPAGAGWVLLPEDEPPGRWAAERLAGASLSFRQGEFWSHPALTIYAQQGTPLGAIPLQVEAHVAPSDWPPEQALAEGVAIAAPVATAGPLSFLGYEIQTQSDGVELHTYWRVDEVPARPLSLMAHLLADDGTLEAVGDGLGVPIEVWQPGDVIVQRHRLAISQDAAPGPYWLQTGAYWLNTLERWPILENNRVIGDRLLLTEVTP